MLGPANPGAAGAAALPRQRLFLLNGRPVTDEDRERWRKVLAQEGGLAEQARQVSSSFGDMLMMAFNPRRARERAGDSASRRARARIYQRRDLVERVLVEQLGKRAALLRDVLAGQVGACALALARANQEAGRLADRIDPRTPDGYPSTSTYYELETGVVGRDYLQDFYRRAGAVVTAADWQRALEPLYAHLIQSTDVIGAEQLYARLADDIAGNGDLLQRVDRSVDVNHVIGEQHGQEVARARQRPDNRIHQWLDRLNPYIRWDADRFSFHETNLEHIRLAAAPTSRRDDPRLTAATVGQEDFKWIPTGDPTRMDAVWIVHGLPVTLLERLEDYRAQYENSMDFPIRAEFHLNPAWVGLPEITPEADEQLINPSQV
ncbi:MAG: hypothetical protein H6642_17790 [Caldilineaceae bacterium]|nr:hypothetical protein [Caldilineaceae bacterium]